MSTKCLCAAVELHIPDHLQHGPLPLPELARASQARPDRLRQILRVLHNNNIFSYDPTTDSYSNNPTSSLLLSDHWTQWRSWVNLYGNEFYDMTRGVPQACHQSAVRSPAQINFDTDDSMFAYFSKQGWVGKLHKTLSSGATAQAPGILEDYPWGEIGESTILDVGGGGGGLVALLLRKHGGMKAAILDLPHVIEHARTNFHAETGEYYDVRERVPAGNLIAGDFFDRIPAFQIYTMKWCLHDWDDEKASIILKNIRQAIIPAPESRLILFESILEEGRMGRLSRYADMNMMIAIGGQERTEAQWRTLASNTGWRIRRLCRLRNAWPCAIELVPTDPVVTNGSETAKHPELSSFKSGNISQGDDHTTPPNAETNIFFPKESSSSSNQTSTHIRFLEPWSPERGTPYIRIAPAEGYDYMNFQWQDHPVTIADARPAKQTFDIDVHGFGFLDDVESGAPELVEEMRRDGEGTIRTLYYPHVERLLKRVTGASRVIIFDHTMRKRRPELGTFENPTGKEQPATMVCACEIWRMGRCAATDIGIPFL